MSVRTSASVLSRQQFYILRRSLARGHYSSPQLLDCCSNRVLQTRQSSSLLAKPNGIANGYRLRANAPVAGRTVRGRRTLFIQTEETPNVDALKFKPNQRVIPEALAVPFVEYISPRSTLTGPYKSSLATQLLAVDGVSSVFLGSDYITVTKDSGAHWAHVKPEVFSLITLVVSKGEPMVVVNQQQQQLQGDGGDASSTVANAAVYRDEDAEIVAMINELLETRIRPAIQEDGGDIEFRGFEDGVVLLKLRGACRTCDSSTVTLRNGIESMMRHYIPEVREVKQVLDPEEDVAIREFARFEEKLRQQQAGHYPSESGNG